MSHAPPHLGKRGWGQALCRLGDHQLHPQQPCAPCSARLPGCVPNHTGVCRAILGRYLGNASQPAPLQLAFKPFPWPSYQIDPAAGLAAVLFNLLIVFAFLSPTRAIVVTIVREKELRLREGMRILGLTVRALRQCALSLLARARQAATAG